MRFLLDTNVVSELQRRNPHPSVRDWIDRVRDADLYLSVMTIGEIRQGIEHLWLKDKPRAGVLDAWLAGLLLNYQTRLLPVDEAIAQRWGQLNVPQRLPAVDGLIAATALVHDLTLVTRNVGDFGGTGVKLIDPFGLTVT